MDPAGCVSASWWVAATCIGLLSTLDPLVLQACPVPIPARESYLPIARIECITGKLQKAMPISTACIASALDQAGWTGWAANPKA
ncbi:MAG: hypothetical protein GYA24_10475 [Candidatus Lokiarchaeota archaeon]|nr:hypothetical protein [Candidatus Lokiarchaeota archaeon]